MTQLVIAGFVALGLLGAPLDPIPNAGKCHVLKNADQRNLCLAKVTGHVAKYCAKIRGKDLKKYCDATLRYHSRAMCTSIKNSDLKKRCIKELR